MYKNNQEFAGKDGFIWWVGIVEDRFDPLKLGRCKVRCFGWHSENKAQLPTEQLPWAMPLHPTNTHHTYPPKEGEMVFGFFNDGKEAQHPVYFGVYPNIPLAEPNPQNAFSDSRTDEILKTAPRPLKTKTYKTDGSGVEVTEAEKASLYPNYLDEPTTCRLSRNESIANTFIQERKDNIVKDIETFSADSKWSEPETKYNSKYPYNNARETESGHIIEIDDTPGAERIHLAHRTGTFHEIYPNGDVVTKIVGDGYTIIMKGSHLHIMGTCYVNIQGNADVRVQKDAFVKIDQNATVKVDKNVKVEVGGNYDESVKGSYTVDVGGTYKVKSGGNMTLEGSTINLNP